ncbi:MAG: hypothetical protein SVW57_14070 [Thermodesulfobacteriota bacterium]|nr:hypothetical protein [Thermodesulfobacteriota bacterium]
MGQNGASPLRLTSSQCPAVVYGQTPLILETAGNILNGLGYSGWMKPRHGFTTLSMAGHMPMAMKQAPSGSTHRIWAGSGPPIHTIRCAKCWYGMNGIEDVFESKQVRRRGQSNILLSRKTE